MGTDRNLAHGAPFVNGAEPLAYSVNDACRTLSISRTTLYELIKSGRLETAKVGGKRLIPTAALHRLLSAEAA